MTPGATTVDRDVERDFALWCERRKAEQRAQRAARAAIPFVGGHLLKSCTGKRRIDGSYVHVYHRLPVRELLPLPRVFLQGPHRKRFLVPFKSDKGRPRGPWLYDFADDVRELACEQVRFDVYAMWSDPRERWASSCRRT
jgi:hypothetical protein